MGGDLSQTEAKQTDYSITASLDRLQISQKKQTLEISTKKTKKENVLADELALKPAGKRQTNSCETTFNEGCDDYSPLRRSARIQNKSASDKSKLKNYGAKVLSKVYEIKPR
jgi:hypothetical protein